MLGMLQRLRESNSRCVSSLPSITAASLLARSPSSYCASDQTVTKLSHPEARSLVFHSPISALPTRTHSPAASSWIRVRTACFLHDKLASVSVCDSGCTLPHGDRQRLPSRTRTLRSQGLLVRSQGTNKPIPGAHSEAGQLEAASRHATVDERMRD